MARRISFDEYNRNLFEIGERRRLGMFNRACALTGVLNAQVTETQAVFDAIYSILRGRSLSEARGEQLDVIGRIIGQPRVVSNVDVFPWFAPDRADRSPDSGSSAWVTGVPLAGSLPADDVTYLGLIQAKIFKNHVKHCSIPEIINFVNLFYGINISVRKSAAAEIQLVVPAGTPDNIRINLVSEVNDDNADHQYFIPVPSGTRLNPIILEFS